MKKSPKSLIRNIGISVTKRQFRNGKREFAFSRVAFHALRTFVCIIVFVLSYVFVFSYDANAVSAGLGVSKSIMDVDVPAGGSYSENIVVFNNSTSTALPVHIDLLLWNLREDADDIEFVLAEEELNATKWFDISEKDFILEPGGTKTVSYSIDPPQSASPGSYFVMMRFSPTFPEFYFEEEGPRFFPEIGTLFFIRVPILSLEGGQNLYGASINSIEPGGADEIKLVSNFLPRAEASAFDGAVRNLVTRISNTGLYHFKASGSVEIKNIFGRTVARAELPQRYLLPNRERPITVDIFPPPSDDSASFVKGTLESLMYRVRRNTYFGPYSAIVTLSIPDGNPVVESVSFWVIPWQFWLILGLIVFGFLLFIKRFGRHARHRLKHAYRALIGRESQQI